MRVLICSSIAAIGAVLLLSVPLSGVSADEPERKPDSTSGKSAATAAPDKVNRTTVFPKSTSWKRGKRDGFRSRPKGVVTGG